MRGGGLRRSCSGCRRLLAVAAPAVVFWVCLAVIPSPVHSLPGIGKTAGLFGKKKPANGVPSTGKKKKAKSARWGGSELEDSEKPKKKPIEHPTFTVPGPKAHQNGQPRRDRMHRLPLLVTPSGVRSHTDARNFSPLPILQPSSSMDKHGSRRCSRCRGRRPGENSTAGAARS